MQKRCLGCGSHCIGLGFLLGWAAYMGPPVSMRFPHLVGARTAAEAFPLHISSHI